MARDGWKPGVKIAGRLLHAKYSRYMQRIAHVARSWCTSWRRPVRASRTTRHRAHRTISLSSRTMPRRH